MDPVACYPGTRKEVMGSINNWIRSGHLLNPGIYWLTGPAGAGKTAIVQSIAEYCITHNISMANFFFFGDDLTRNHVGCLIETLVFQLLKLYPPPKDHIMRIISDNPIIFDQSLRE